MDEFIECPICGHEKAKVQDVTWSIQEPYGSVESYTFKTISCENCKEEVTGANYDDAITPAINRSQKNAILNIVKFFQENGVNKANLERVFGLHQHSIDKYLEAEEIEPSFYMLMITYRRFHPELLQIADDFHEFNRPKIITDKK